MNNTMISTLYGLLCKIMGCIHKIIDKQHVKLKFYGNNVSFSSFRTRGVPFIAVSRNNGHMMLGKNFAMNNSFSGNQIGSFEPCCFVVGENATLTIGNNTGMSQTAIVCKSHIKIGSNVKIGGGTRIYDTDFHSLDWKLRRNMQVDSKNTKHREVIIGDDVFIGTCSIILKGVTIGDRSIIAAGSVVSRSIPSDEIWGGNPAKLIRKILD